MPGSEGWLFFAPGKPVTQGSKRMVRTRRGRPLMIEASRNLHKWRETVALAARRERVALIDGDVEVSIVACWPRPDSHLRKDGSIRPSCPSRPGYADCDKLCRAICDALAGIAYANDRQVALLCIERRWAGDGEVAGAWIRVREAAASGCWRFSSDAPPPARE
jgi:Holliday junction resolvase RusA-like endonuclease